MILSDGEYDALKENPLFDVERNRLVQKAQEKAMWAVIVGTLLSVILGNQLGLDFFVYGIVGTIIAALKYWRD